MNEVVRFFSEREAYNLCDKSDSDFWIGNFNASTCHLVRKDCTIYRYKTREWHMGSFIIMLNHKNGRAYFVKDYDVDDIEFETKGIKCRFINIII